MCKHKASVKKINEVIPALNGDYMPYGDAWVEAGMLT
jgi:hypothetical protein